MTTGEQTREPGRQEQWGRECGAGPTWSTRPRGRGGFLTLRRGVVGAGLRHGRAPQGTGEGDAADNGAEHHATEPADEAHTNPLVGLGRKAGGGKRDRHCSWTTLVWVLLAGKVWPAAHAIALALATASRVAPTVTALGAAVWGGFATVRLRASRAFYGWVDRGQWPPAISGGWHALPGAQGAIAFLR